MKIKNTSFILLLSWLVSALAILGVGFVIQPSVYVNQFWYRVVWVEVLNLLFWWENSGWFTENKESTSTSFVPTISFFTSVYCIVSFILIVAFYEKEVVSRVDKIHLVMQILLFAAYSLFILRLQLSAHFADKDLSINTSAAISPMELGNQIKYVENDYSEDISKELKKLREKITYSLQNTNNIRMNNEYKNLVDSISSQISNQNITLENVKKFIVSVETIRNNVKRG